MRRSWAGLCGLAWALAATGCAGPIDVGQEGDAPEVETERLSASSINADGLDVDDLVSRVCSTSSLGALSQQLIEEIECLAPGTMKPIGPRANLQLGAAVFPFLQVPAADALGRALDATSTTMRMTSALRSLPQQYLLYRWGQQRRCGIGVAAPPGRSNHNGGLAIDLSNWSSWRSRLSAQGFRWFGSSDPVHFDYVRGGRDIRALSVRAFQRLWNRNHPNDRIAEDGAWGPATESRLRRSPAVGFALGATCRTPTPPAAEPKLDAIEVYWFRNADGSYKLRALAPASVSRVSYHVDGFQIAEADRAQANNFPASYTFSQPGSARSFEVRGVDDQGNPVALGIGTIDVTPEVGVYIRQLGEGFYAIGLERAPLEVSYIEVEADGFALGTSAESDRLEVRYRFGTLGEREIAISTFEDDGSFRGTIRRTVTLR